MEREIITTYRKETSLNGIRTDIVDKAIWCAIELYLFRLVEGGKRIYTNLVHRLMVIYMEDIGCTNIGIYT